MYIKLIKGEKQALLHGFFQNKTGERESVRML
jgi:hypothetical protein